MKCARCSAEVPRQSQFCLRCGTPINAAANYAPPIAQNMPIAAAPSNQKPLYAVIGLLAVAVLALVGWMVRSSLAQKPGETHATSMITAPATTNPGPLIAAPGATQPQTPIIAPPSQPTQKPDYSYIDDYLRFVRQVERTKAGLIHRQLAATLSQYANMMGDEVKAATDDEASKDFLPNINKNPANLSDEWNKLTQVFLARRPPPECVELHDKYYDHLSKVQGMFNKVHDAVAQANSGNSGDALNALTAMMGTASSEADDSARSADDALDDICRQYKLEKTFKIQTDSGTSGSLLH